MTKKQKALIDRDLMFFSKKMAWWKQKEIEYFREAMNEVIDFNIREKKNKGEWK